MAQAVGHIKEGKSIVVIEKEGAERIFAEIDSSRGGHIIRENMITRKQIYRSHYFDADGLKTFLFNCGIIMTCPQCDGPLYNNHCTSCEQRGQ
jgi:hypothetical protein